MFSYKDNILYYIESKNFEVGYIESLRLLLDKGENVSPRSESTLELSPFIFKLKCPKNNCIQNMIHLTDSLLDNKDSYLEYLKRIKLQLNKIIQILQNDENSRKAVINIFDGFKDNDPDDFSCTIMFHFLIRDNKLNMNTYMRSNEAYERYPADVYIFTKIQQFISRQLDKELGEYLHIVGSFHLYEKDIEKVQKIV